ncbi:hypothetical protein [Flavobacterium chungbukense]|uniref:hypothetical protein n=1 Tax=Flavobacterium chungbukense TaxID=877464 RepID=UPI0039F007FB
MEKSLLVLSTLHRLLKSLIKSDLVEYVRQKDHSNNADKKYYSNTPSSAGDCMSIQNHLLFQDVHGLHA